MVKTRNRVYRYHLTIYLDFDSVSEKPEDYYREGLERWFNDNCKKWVYQLEKSENGMMHFQCVISLIKKEFSKKVLSSISSYTGIKEDYINISPSLTGNTSFCYAMKDDTRVDGPWTDKDEVIPLTAQMKIFNSFTLRPYQTALKEMACNFDMRKIDLVYDPNGNIGKSLFSEYLEYNGLAEEIPPFRLMDDIFQWVCSRPIKKCYIVDMPRGMKKDKLGDFYSGIEIIKNGVAYDKRYNAKKIRFDRPRIFVFTNMLPEFSLMSADRWNVWKVGSETSEQTGEQRGSDYQLLPYMNNNIQKKK